MAWNKPDNDDENDPWGGKRKNEEDELEESLRQFQNKLKKLFSSGGKHSSGSNFMGGAGFLMGCCLIVVLWAASGLFKVDQAEKALVLRFGKYHDTLEPGGPYWIPRFIDTVEKVNVEEVSSYSYHADMLTEDENIVTISIAVQYRRDNPRAYRYNVVNPIRGLEEATASALRQVVGDTKLDNILTVGRETVRSKVEVQLKKLMLKYDNGLTITNVALQPAKAPEQVRDAFDDAIKAREDEDRFINNAEAEVEAIEQKAIGQERKLLNAAEGYRHRVVLNARADVAGYLAILPEYQKSKRVTRERMYYDAIQHVLQNTTKLLIGTGSGGNNMFYLPLDKILEQSKHDSKKRENVVEEKPLTIIQNDQLLKQPQQLQRESYLRKSRFSDRGVY